jgi:hypothetical protein
MSEYDSMAACDTSLLVVEALFQGFRCGCLNYWKQGQTTSLNEGNRIGHFYVSTPSDFLRDTDC